MGREEDRLQSGHWKRSQKQGTCISVICMISVLILKKYSAWNFVVDDDGDFMFFFSQEVLIKSYLSHWASPKRLRFNFSRVWPMHGCF